MKLFYECEEGQEPQGFINYYFHNGGIGRKFLMKWKDIRLRFCLPIFKWEWKVIEYYLRIRWKPEPFKIYKRWKIWCRKENEF